MRVCTVFICMLFFRPSGTEKSWVQESARLQRAVLGAGCFWCVEAVFERLPGVHSVTSGFAGGTRENPTDKEVSTGTTGHAEVVQVLFDSSRISFEKLLEMFWRAHDPTLLNRQDEDVGPQYRSVIFYEGEEQRLAAEVSKREAQKLFKDRIVTEIGPMKQFFKAKDFHQDYYKRSPNAPYCKFVIKPKLRKLKLDD